MTAEPKPPGRFKVWLHGALIRGALHKWRGPWPPVSIVGLIALTIAFVALIPSIIGVVKVSREADRLAAQQKRIIAQQQQIRTLAKEGADAHASACSYRSFLHDRVADARRQVKSTRRYIADVASGRRQAIPGITTADLQRALHDQLDAEDRATKAVASLHKLRCGKPGT